MWLIRQRAQILWIFLRRAEGNLKVAFYFNHQVRHIPITRIFSYQQEEEDGLGVSTRKATRPSMCPGWVITVIVLKAIHKQKLYRADNQDEYSNLQPVLKRAIDWKLIRQQYDQMVKYATALRLGTAETEAVLRRFTRSNLQHPTYKALAELGKAIKTIFLCRYLHSIELRREIHEGLNVIEHWNSVNGFILYGKGGEFATNRREDQEVTMLSLHLLQLCLVYINTLMMQQVLSQEQGRERLQAEDLRALTPLVYGHVTPYGTFRLDMSKRLEIEQAATA